MFEDYIIVQSNFYCSYLIFVETRIIHDEYLNDASYKYNGI